MSGILKIRQAMKKKYLIAAALLAVCGCQKSNESPVVTGKADKIQAYVEDNADTKTIATQNGKSLDFVWAKGDKIGVVTASASDEVWGYKNGNNYSSYEYTLDGEGENKEGTFSATTGTPDGEKYLAIYPREATSGVTRGKYVNFCYTIPVDQKYVANGFDTKYAVMCAISDSKENMVFKHYSSVLKLNIKAAKGFDGVRVQGIKVTEAPRYKEGDGSDEKFSICGMSYFQKAVGGTTIKHLNGYQNTNNVINYSVPGVVLSSDIASEFNIVFNPECRDGIDSKYPNERTFTFEINTDRGVITKTKKLSLRRGVVYNMPVFEVKLTPQNVYFFNGSTTLSAPNLSTKVEGTDKFTSLTIVPNDKTGKITLSETELETISNYIKEYGSETGVKLDLSKAYYTSNVWPNTFRNNVKLQSISLPLNITKGSKNGDLGDGSAPFMGCTKLSEIILDEAMVSLPDMFLNGVPSIKTINLTKYVRDIYWLQNDSDANLENIKVDENNTNLYADKGVLYRRYNDKKTNKIVKSLQYIPVANTAALTKDGEDYIYTLPSDVLYICQAAFHCNKNITKIVVTNSFESIVGGYVFGTKKLKVMDFSALNHVPTINVNATLSLGPKGGEIWCASDDMVTKFKSDEKWSKVASDADWTFKVKPATTKSQAPAISNLNSSKPDFSWE